MDRRWAIAIVFLLVGTGFWFQGCATQSAQKKEVTVRCAITGEEIKEWMDALKVEYKGETYYFCCEPCKVEFEKDPEKYLGRVRGEGDQEKAKKD